MHPALFLQKRLVLQLGIGVKACPYYFVHEIDELFVVHKHLRRHFVAVLQPADNGGALQRNNEGPDRSYV